MTPQPPESLTQERPRKPPGTLRDTTSARRPPSPPLYRAGTDANPGTNTPTWLADKITTNRRQARSQPCPRCGQPTLVGPDHDTCAATARVDPNPVDRIQEVIARLTGRSSYDLHRGALHYREPEHIHATNHPHPIHLEHTCTKGQLR